MSIDILFLAKNRRAFTEQALRAYTRNTYSREADWDLTLCDDGSTDGTLELLQSYEYKCTLRQTNFGSPVLAFNDFVQRSEAEFIVKLDNDTMVPPGWLYVCMGIMARYPHLELLGLECYGRYRDVEGRHAYYEAGLHAYYPADHVGGIFIARRSAFTKRPLPKADGIFYGFTDWQREHDVVRGWIAPPLPVFLLDRLPFEPWASLSAEYEAAGYQRWWKRYNLSQSDLWKWAFPEHA